MVSRNWFAGYMFGGGEVGTGRVEINLIHLLHKNMSEKHQALHLQMNLTERRVEQQ